MRRQDPRTYITVHDGMPDHPKIVGLSDAAFRALVTGWCWCSRYLTDGRMPAEVWSRIGNKRCRDELLRNANVRLTDDGLSVDFHDYLEHQRSRQDVLDLREKRAAAGAKGGRASTKDASKPQASASRFAKQNASIVREQKVPTEVGTEKVSTDAHVSDAGEEPHTVEEEPRSRPVSMSARKLSRAYTDIVKLVDIGKVCGVITNAQAAGYTDDKITAALGRMAHDNRPVSPDALRIELDNDGKQRLPNGMTKDAKGIVRLANGVAVAGPGWEAY